MAATQTLDDGEFWLPPQFLTDDDVFIDKMAAVYNNGGTGLKNTTTKCLFSPLDLPYGLGRFGGSDLSSPVESVLSSTDSAESDEEDYLAGLTRQMAHSTLEDDFTSLDKASKGWGMACSPQSTLCAAGNRCGCRQGSRRGSPNGPSPAATWDLLYAAAGEVARMRINEELYGWNNKNKNGFFAPPRKHSPISPPAKNHTHPDLALYQKLQASQFRHLRQQQMMKTQQQQQYQSLAPVGHGRVARTNSTVGNDNGRLLGLSPSAWPPLQENGSGMRAVFLGNRSVKRECAGTGVFLPRRVGAPEPRKKPACSTALLPAKVVQALNLNMEEMGPTRPPQFHQPRFNGGGFSPESVIGSQKRSIKPQVINAEVRLPQEWTY